MTNPLSELIARGEGGYGSYNRGRAGDANGRTIDFSQMTVGELQALQHLPRQDPDRLFAVGKYQIIPGTMDLAVRALRLDPNERFTPELQERIFSEYLISQKQPGIRAYITGQPGATLHNAQQQLANEWASVADPDTGLSVHGRVGNNRASITADQAAEALNAMRARYAENVRQGMSAEDAWRAVTAVDPQAAQRLNEGAERRTEGAEQRPTRGGAMADGVLREGDRGPEVTRLQESLNRLGYTGRNGEPLETRSGIFGPETKHAVEAFQRAHGLGVDGRAGRDTLPAIARAATNPLVSEATHPSHALFAEIQRRLPESTRPEAVANITLQALENGITSPDRLRGLQVSGSNVHLQGPFEGARVSVDLQAPTAGLQAMSDHMARQTQEQSREQSRTRDDSRPTQLPPVISV